MITGWPSIIILFTGTDTVIVPFMVVWLNCYSLAEELVEERDRTAQGEQVN